MCVTIMPQIIVRVAMRQNYKATFWVIFPIFTMKIPRSPTFSSELPTFNEACETS